MRYSIIALSLAIAARAQTRDDIPECALSCLEDAITEAAPSCDVDDDACACDNIEAIQGAATGCVVSNCGVETAVNEVIPAVEALCQAQGGDDGEDDGEDDGSDEPETPEDPEEGDDEEEEPEEPEMPEEPEHPEEPEKPEDDECSTVHPSHAPTNGTGPEPTHAPEPVPEPTEGEPTPVPTAGAALIGSMGGLALAGIAALAL